MCVKARRREYLNFKSRLESVYAARGVRRCGCECVSLKVNQRRRGGEREKREREREGETDKEMARGREILWLKGGNRVKSEQQSCSVASSRLAFCGSD